MKKKLVTTSGQLSSGQLPKKPVQEDDGRNAIRKFTYLTTKHIIFRTLCTSNFPIGTLLILSYDALEITNAWSQIATVASGNKVFAILVGDHLGKL